MKSATNIVVGLAIMAGLWAFVMNSDSDLFPWAKAKERMEAQARVASGQKTENEAEKKAAEEAAAKKKAEEEAAAKKAAEEEAKKKAALAAAAEKDLELFSARVSAVTDEEMKSPDATRPAVLVKLLADAELNRLARKYLKRDFSLARNELIGRIREADRQKKAFEEALAKNEGAYRAGAAQAAESRKEKLAGMKKSLAEIDARIAQLEKERSSLERRLGSRTERETTDRLIAKNRNELERLRDNRNALKMGTAQQSRLRDIDSDERVTLNNLEFRRQNQEDHIRRTQTPKLDAFKAAEECEAKTLKALETAISDTLAGK